MKKLFTALLLSITLIQLCWAAVGSFREHPATLAKHAEHNQLHAKDTAKAAAAQAVQDDGQNGDAAGFCSSCEMHASSIGYPSAAMQRRFAGASVAPSLPALSFSSHIPDHPEEPDWLAAHPRGVAARF